MESIRPEDGRSPWQRMSRREIWRALKAAGVNFPAGITSEDGIKLLQANRINPMEVMAWDQIPVKDEKGNVRLENYPKRTEPKYSESDMIRRDAEMERRLEEAAVKANKAAAKKAMEKTDNLQGQVSELAEQVNKLTQILLQQQNSQPQKKPKETDPRRMKYMAFKKWCKEHGHDLQKGEDKEALIAQLEG